MSCNIGKYLNEVGSTILREYPSLGNIEQVTLYKVKKEYPESIGMIEEHILNQLSNRQIKVYKKDGGKYNSTIVGIEVEPNGLLTVQTRVGDGKIIPYRGINLTTGMSKQGYGIPYIGQVRAAVFPEVQMQKKVSKTYEPSGFNDLTKPITGATVIANRYVSNMLIGGTIASGGILKPHIDRWHEQAKNSSSMYKEVMNAISTGFGNQELLDKIKVTLNVSGDMSRKTLAEVTNISELSARRTKELLDTEMPKLDKAIQAQVKNKAHRDNLDLVFGTSGFGNLYDIEGLVGKLEDGRLKEDKKTPRAPEELEAYFNQVIKDFPISDKDKETAKDLMEYQVGRKVTGELQNAGSNKSVAAFASLLALQKNNSAGYKTLMYMHGNHPKLYVELRQLSGALKTLSEVINDNKESIRFGKGSGETYNGYDGHYTMDVFENTHEFRVLSKREIDTELFRGKSPWKVLREPTKDNPGIVFKESNNSYQDGLGTNQDRIRNGIAVEAAYVEKMVEEHGEGWLQRNNIIYDQDTGAKRYRVVLKRSEFKDAGGMNNIAHRMYRTYVHNLGLVETEAARKLIVEKMTTKANEAGLERLEQKLKDNEDLSGDNRYEIKAFLNTSMGVKEMAKKFPLISKKYKRVENISNYGKFHEEVKYVRRDMADMVVGYKQSSFVSDDWPNVQEWEKVYKQLVQMLKLKLVVANPAKLGVDVLSNVGVLMTMDVGATDLYKYSKEAITYTDQMSKMEGKLVQAKLQLSLAEVDGKGVGLAQKKVDHWQNKIESHPFYDATRFGFIQSMGTSMMIKEFDTVSGLQHTIDEVVKKVVQDKDGNPNKAHDAIKWWMDAGFGINDILDSVSNMNAIKGTSFSQELSEMGQRLKDKKTTEDTVRYIGEFVASPSSEIIRQGSRAMQMGDVAARWTLYRTRIEQAVENSKDKLSDSELEQIRVDVSLEALDTFIDYRLNMPSEIKALSDIGVLMFPSFWIRAQKIIYNLAKYHPLNAGGGYLTADLLDMHGASILDANVLTKLGNGTLVSPGQDVLDFRTFILGGTW